MITSEKVSAVFLQFLRKPFLHTSDRCSCFSLLLSFPQQVYLKRVYLVAMDGHVPFLSKAWLLNFAPLSFLAKMISF